MGWPTIYDNIPSVISGQTIASAQEIAQTNAINAIESNLGLWPAGGYASAAAAFAGMARIPTVQNQGYSYALATTSGTSYAVSITPAPAAYTKGMRVTFKANVAGLDFVNVNGLGAIVIHNPSFTPIQAGQIVTVVYDGTFFQLQPGQLSAPLGFSVASQVWLASPGNTFNSTSFVNVSGCSGTFAIPPAVGPRIALFLLTVCLEPAATFPTQPADVRLSLNSGSSFLPSSAGFRMVTPFDLDEMIICSLPMAASMGSGGGGGTVSVQLQISATNGASGPVIMRAGNDMQSLVVLVS